VFQHGLLVSRKTVIGIFNPSFNSTAQGLYVTKLTSRHDAIFFGSVQEVEEERGSTGLTVSVLLFGDANESVGARAVVVIVIVVVIVVVVIVIVVVVVIVIVVVIGGRLAVFAVTIAITSDDSLDHKRNGCFGIHHLGEILTTSENRGRILGDLGLDDGDP
jgi:hypothetical protein